MRHAMARLELGRLVRFIGSSYCRGMRCRARRYGWPTLLHISAHTKPDRETLRDAPNRRVTGCPQRPGLSTGRGAKVRQDREHSPMAVRHLVQAQLAEDAPDVCLDGL